MGAKSKFATDGCDVDSLSKPGTKARLGQYKVDSSLDNTFHVVLGCVPLDGCYFLRVHETTAKNVSLSLISNFYFVAQAKSSGNTLGYREAGPPAVTRGTWQLALPAFYATRLLFRGFGSRFLLTFQ